MNPILLAPLAVGIISAVLGALIAATDKIVNNYGDVPVNINAGKKQVIVKGGQSLLLGLAEQGIFIPSACGGRGSCGACKVRVTSDIGPVLPTEVPYLDAKELQNQTRLACQVKVKSAIDITIPEALFNIRKFAGTVERIRSVTHDIKEVYIRLPEGETCSYVAGQYGQFEVPAYDKLKAPTQRAYSMSSTPADANHLEFLIRLVPGGIVTTYVHNHLKEGDPVNIVAPAGDFHARATDATMICVAGGSGMAPFKAIFNNMVDSGEINNRDVWYFFGARTVRDMFYLDWLRQLDTTHERFHFVPALSEPQAGEPWQGETGLITDVLGRYLDTIIGKDKDREGYLCGSPGMLDACMNVMRKYGMPEEKIYFDKFA